MNLTFSKHYKDIKKGGINEFFRKFISLSDRIFQLPFYFLAPILFLVIFFLKNLILIRFCNTRSGRIGHFALNIDSYIHRKHSVDKSKKNQSILDIFYNDKEVCNNFLNKKWKKEIIIFPRIVTEPLVKFIIFFCNIVGINNIFVFNLSIYHQNYKSLFNKFKPFLKLDEEEVGNGKNFLKSLSIDDDAKIVLLIVRDSAYLETVYPAQDYSYHSYRNIDIKDFEEAAIYLAEMGYYVFRMGKIVKDKFDVKHKKIFDYANMKERSDFLDIFLCSICSFAISTSTGIDGVVSVFKKLFGSIIAPIGHANSTPNVILYPKIIFSNKSQKNLPLKDILKNGYMSISKSSDYSLSDLKIVNPNSSQIKDFAEEMHERFLNQLSVNSNTSNEIFREIMFSHINKDIKLRDQFGNLEFNLSKSFLIHNNYYLK